MDNTNSVDEQNEVPAGMRLAPTEVEPDASQAPSIDKGLVTEGVEVAGEPQEELSPAEKNRRELQSRADKAESEKDRIMEEFESLKSQFEQVKPIADLIDKDERVRNALLDAMNGSQGGQAEATTTAQPQAPSLEKPARPTKPVNYSPWDALNDPGSDSAKYDTAMEQYLVDMANYSVSVQEQAAARIEAERKEAAERQRLQDQETQSRNQWITDLTSKHGFSKADAMEATDFASNLSMEDMQEIVATYFRHKLKGASAEEAMKAAKKQQLDEEAKRRTAPVSAAAIVGAGEKEQDSKQESAFVVHKQRSMVGLKS